MADTMSIDKKDLVDGESPVSPGSSLGADNAAGSSVPGSNGNASNLNADGQQPKRKGGRKPVSDNLQFLLRDFFSPHVTASPSCLWLYGLRLVALWPLSFPIPLPLSSPLPMSLPSCPPA
jgi:hypothetical protein